jgi:ADP-ribose pyrophosphatase YjhB (NUDIX family)
MAWPSLSLRRLSSIARVVPKPAVAVAVCAEVDGVRKYLLGQRGKQPAKGQWSLPGG